MKIIGFVGFVPADFAFPAKYAPEEEQPSQTGEGRRWLMDVFSYHAPEQISSRKRADMSGDRGNIDGRADIYSLGLTFYYLLTAPAISKGRFSGAADGHPRGKARTDRHLPPRRSGRADQRHRSDDRQVACRTLPHRPGGRPGAAGMAPAVASGSVRIGMLCGKRAIRAGYRLPGSLRPVIQKMVQLYHIWVQSPQKTCSPKPFSAGTAERF